MNKAQLRSHIQDVLVGHDLQDSVVDFFIDEVEQEFDRTLRVRRMLESAFVSTPDSLILIPNGYLEMKNFYTIGSGNKRIELLPVSQHEANRQSYKLNSLPNSYSVVGRNFLISPKPTSSRTYEILFYSRIPKLVNDSDTNWILDYYKGLYVNGVLVEAGAYVGGDSRMNLWLQMRDSLHQRIKMEDERASYGSSPLVMKPAYVF